MDEFRRAGRTLFSLGMVRGAEGNLSTFDGTMLVITRTGVPLGNLGPDDLVTGELEDVVAEASSDLAVHRRMYAERGPGAIVHAHPPGTVPEGGGGPGGHGVYTFAEDLTRAVEVAVEEARDRAARGDR